MRKSKTYGGLTFYKSEQTRVLIVAPSKKNAKEQLDVLNLRITNFCETGNAIELGLTAGVTSGVWVKNNGNAYVEESYTKISKEIPKARTMKEIWDSMEIVGDRTAEVLGTLYCRWQDEKEYEDINDYFAAIKEVIPEAKSIKGRPFSIVCEASDGKMQIKITRKGITAKQIK